MADLIYKDEAYEIISKCMDVHRIPGHGFLEAFYKDALEYEFQLAGTPYRREHPFEIPFKDIILRNKYHADFTVFDKIILEAKALDALHDHLLGRAMNYLKVSRRVITVSACL